LKLIKDPVHGYITLTEAELKLVDTMAVQRLRRISQLPLVYLVYPGARHSRFDHSLGCMFLAGEFAQHLGLDEHKTSLLKTAALLHDLGHTPYSHLLEQILAEKGLSHEVMSMRIIEEDGEVCEALEEMGLSRKEVVDVLNGSNVLSSLVSGPLDVDRLDFLVRDAYFTGATYGVVDVKRIIRLTKLLEDGPAIDARGAGAVEELALARYHSFINIYFHHAVRAAQLLLLKGVRLLSDEIDFASMSVDEYLGYDDYVVWCMMKQRRETRWVIDRLERRILPQRVFEKQVLGEVKKPLKETDIEQTICERLGLDPRKVYVDYSHAPPLTKYGPGEIKLTSEPYKAPAESWILRELAKPIHIIRVYVDRDISEADRVRKAADEIIHSIS
jgi:HD superfamily phosphohydrolase